VRRRLDHLWRLVATGGAFAALFGGGGVLAVTILPLLALLPGHSRERAQMVVHLTFRCYLATLKMLGVIRFDLDGAEKLKQPGGRLVIANHPSLLDVVFLMSLIPKAQCIVKHQLWTHPLLGPLMRRAGYIRNDLDPEQLVAACRESLADGNVLIIFPEGTRSQPGETPRFRRGFANLATLTGAPIQLVLITCDPPTLFKGEPWWKIPPRAPHFQLIVDECLDANHYLQYPHRSLAARKLVQSLEQYYAEKLANVPTRN
jgi:1-acyl-sn-glycerol-3-phosphate acyltransferase